MVQSKAIFHGHLHLHMRLQILNNLDIQVHQIQFLQIAHFLVHFVLNKESAQRNHILALTN